MFVLKTLTKEDFKQALEQKFVLHAGGGETLELSLAAVTDLDLQAPKSERVRSEPFSLLFHGPATPWARQHTYRLHNQTLGDLDVFLVPLGVSGKQMQYEAVFT